jgi:hypothetical protein
MRACIATIRVVCSEYICSREQDKERTQKKPTICINKAGEALASKYVLIRRTVVSEKSSLGG